MLSNGVSQFFLQVVWGGGGVLAVEVGNAAVLGNWILRRMWEVSVGKLVMGSLERRTR
jgi:hypothetical protein